MSTIKTGKNLSTKEKMLIHKIESAQKSVNKAYAMLQDLFSKKKASPSKVVASETSLPKIKVEEVAFKALKIIGRPATVKEMSSRIWKERSKLPVEFKKFMPTKRKLTQVMYNVCSNMSLGNPEKKIKPTFQRKHVNAKTFEYWFIKPVKMA